MGFPVMDGGIEEFIQSALFSKTFKEGMALVEETANYLDGEGREHSKAMARSVAMSYAGASMRLTTQLMQIASWLLVLRALREGDMKLSEAKDPKYRITQREDAVSKRAINEALPEDLIMLIKRSDRLYNQISRLDEGLFVVNRAQEPLQGAVAQQKVLLDAFASGKRS